VSDSLYHFIITGIIMMESFWNWLYWAFTPIRLLIRIVENYMLKYYYGVFKQTLQAATFFFTDNNLVSGHIIGVGFCMSLHKGSKEAVTTFHNLPQNTRLKGFFASPYVGHYVDLKVVYVI
jgi:hypothetical protein